MRLLFLKYILEQPEQSNVKRMFELQLEMPSRGDWASTCKKDLNYLQIGLSLEEIRNISKRKYSTILKDKTREFALKYLLEKRGSKGKEIQFSNLEMADYLLPFNNCLTIDEKCELFAVKNRMIDIPNNFSSKSEHKCECGEIETMSHIYKCELYNEGKQQVLPYEKIFCGSLNEEIEVYRKFKQNLEKRDKMKHINYPCDFGPLYLSKG